MNHPTASDFEPAGLATGIGSLPHTDVQTAVSAVLQFVEGCPFWPQLPKISYLEGMTLQYVNGLPGVKKRKDNSVFVDVGERGRDELVMFFNNLLGNEFDELIGPKRFVLSPKRAKGFYRMLKALAAGGAAKARCVKGHITGPVTMVTALKDQNGKDILYDMNFREAIAAHLAKNAVWQIERLKKFGKPVIIFLDEPVMEVFGSAYSTLDRETVQALWTPALEAIREAGALSGIHCCGNTDWDLLMSCGTDIVNFDAYNYMEKITLYPEKTQSFLAGGGILAWGVVPTDEKARGETPETLLRRLEEGFDEFASRGVDRRLLRKRCLITPSCGMGSLSVELSEIILKLLHETSLLFQRGHGA
jgi:methionine synthase II (cobalamin-independent)